MKQQKKICLRFLSGKIHSLVPGTAISLAFSLPLLMLVVNSLSKLIQDGLFTINLPSLAIIANSFYLAFMVAILSVITGFLVSLWVISRNEKTSRIIGKILPLLCLIPHFVHIQSWVRVADYFFNILNRSLGLNLNFNGPVAVVFISVISYMPFAATVFYFGLRSITSGTAESILIEEKISLAFLKVTAFHLSDVFFLAFTFISVLNLNDFGIASSFGVNTVALDLFARFSAGDDIYKVTATGFIYILFALLVLFPVNLGINKIKAEILLESSRYMKRIIHSSKLLTHCSIFGGAILSVITGIPMVTMLFDSLLLKGYFKEISNSLTSGIYSVIVSLFAGIITSVIICSFIYYARSKKIFFNISAMLAIPFLVPSSIAGLAMIEFWNQRPVDFVFDSPIMPIVAYMCKFAAVPGVYAAVRVSKLDESVIDSLRIEGVSSMQFYKVFKGELGSDILVCSLIIFSLAMGDYAIATMVTPPGYQLLTVKIYNYIHYGAAKTVLAMNLATILPLILAAFGIFYINERKSEH